MQGEIEADVCVIGAGFTGISAALQLAENGYKVVVLEGERIGFGASGRNGGQIVNGYSRDLETIAKRYGADKAVKLGEYVAGRRPDHSRTGARYDIQCDLVDGGFFAAFTEKQIREMDAGTGALGKARPFRAGNGLRADGRALCEERPLCGGMIDRFGGISIRSQSGCW